MATILVTGITGFVAGHVARELLERGYQVRGTLRDMARADGIRATYADLGHDMEKLEFFELDLETDEGWSEAMNGCDAVQHLASPFPMDEPKDKMALVPSAKGGALRVLSHARAAGVLKMVLTSSTVAVTNGVNKPKGEAFTEADWSDHDSPNIRAYALSKTLAEKAAWEDVEQNGGPELTVMNPSFVVGPLLDKSISTSGTLIQHFFKGKFPAVPELCFGIVDVRDVAKAHVNAMERDEANGKRFLLTGGTMVMIDMARALKRALPERSSRLPKFQLPKPLVHVAALFNGSVKGLLPEVGKVYDIDNSRACNILDIEFISPEEALAAMADSLVKHRLI